MSCRTIRAIALWFVLLVLPRLAMAQAGAAPVTVETFIRAETDNYFATFVKRGGLGTLTHRRTPTPIDSQDVVRMNRDTFYSSGIFDLDAGPVTITLPDAGGRFMSLLIVDQDHYNPFVGHAPGRFTFTRQQVGTRYMAAIVRTLADPNDPADMRAANAAQDRITVQQASRGSFEVPAWDQASLAKVREALATLGTLQGRDPGVRFGKKGEVDPVSHLIGTATGWGGNPAEAAVYVGGFPAANDGRTVHRVTVKDVPVDGFWSLSVYDATGYFAKNDLGVYSVNNLTAKPNPDGSVTVQFGGCGKGVANCIPITPGWSYVTRLYRPRAAVLDGTWVFPEPKPAG